MFSSSLPAPLFLVSRSCRSGTEKFTLTLTLNPQHLHSEEVSAANKSPCFALPSDTSSMLLRAKKSFALSLSLYLSCKLFRARRSQTKAHCRDCRSLSTSPWNRGSEMGLRHCQTRDIVMKAEDKKKALFWSCTHPEREFPHSPGFAGSKNGVLPSEEYSFHKRFSVSYDVEEVSCERKREEARSQSNNIHLASRVRDKAPESSSATGAILKKKKI